MTNSHRNQGTSAQSSLFLIEMQWQTWTPSVGFRKSLRSCLFSLFPGTPLSSWPLRSPTLFPELLKTSSFHSHELLEGEMRQIPPRRGFWALQQNIRSSTSFSLTDNALSPHRAPLPWTNYALHTQVSFFSVFCLCLTENILQKKPG